MRIPVEHSVIPYGWVTGPNKPIYIELSRTRRFGSWQVNVAAVKNHACHGPTFESRPIDFFVVFFWFFVFFVVFFVCLFFLFCSCSTEMS